MKKLLTLFLATTAAAALVAFAGCQDPTPPGPGPGPDTKPEITTTDVTYHFVNGEDTFQFKKTQDKGSALGYDGYTKVTYENVWYSSADLQTEVSEASGDTMDVYTSFTDIEVYAMFRSENKTLSDLEIETTLRDGMTLPAAPSRTGYSFAGWMLDGESYAAGSAFDAEGTDGDLVFNAKWNAESYSVTYVNGEDKNTVTQEYSSEVAEAPEKTGYTFLGWFDGETKVEKISGEATLTAKWQAYKYNVTFNLGAYTGEFAYEDGEFEYSQQITLASLSQSGYSFGGWTVKVDDGEEAAIQDSYQVGSNIAAKNIFLTATFNRLEHRVTIHGKDSETEIVFLVGDDYYALLEEYAAEDFDGWFYDEALTMPIAYKAKVADADGDVYGSFTGKTFTATLVNGENTSDATYSYGAVIAEGAAEHGYAFDGWYDSDGELCEKMPASNITLTAQFIKANFVLSYYDGEASVPESVTAEYLSKVTLVAPAAAESYKTFVGWSYNGETYAAGDEIVIDDNIRLEAVWSTYQIHVSLVDWDGYVIFDEDVDAGWEITVPAGSVYEKAEEFAGFYNEDIFGKTVVYPLGEKLTADLEATAYYVNRSNNPATKGQQLKFMDVSTFFFYKTGSTYSVSGREWHYELQNGVNTPVMDDFFIAKALDRDLNLPVTYQGALVTELPTGYMLSKGAFAAYASSTSYEYENYRIKGTVYIPSAYTKIGSYAFSGQTASVIEIGRNSSLTRLESNCSFLMEARAVYGFPAKLSVVGNYAMSTGKYVMGVEDSFVIYDDGEKPSRLTALPSSITYIGGSAFRGCDVFETVDLSNVYSLGNLAFSDNDNIKTLIIGNKLTSLPSQVFRNCDGFTSVTIPAQMTSIGSFAFGNCEKLSDVKFTQENSKLETIDSFAFYSSPLTKVILPDSVTEIGYGAFSFNFASTAAYWSVNDDITSYVTEIKLSANLVSIGSYAFYGAQIESIEFPNTLQYIGFASFMNTNIKKVEIPDSVTLIEDLAFAKLEKYDKTITPADNFVLRIGKGVTQLGGRPSEVTPNVFIHGMVFRGFNNITGIEFPEDSELTYITDFTFFNMHGLKGEIIFPSKLEYLGGYMFSYCSTGGSGGSVYWQWSSVEGSDITKVYIPKSVNNVGIEAFANCRKLSEVVFENNYEEDATLRVMLGAFKNCISLKKITLPCQLTQLFASSLDENSGAFAYCTALEEVTFDGRGEYGDDSDCDIYSATFWECTSLKKIYTNRNKMINIALHSTFKETDINNNFLKHSSGVRLYINKNLANSATLKTSYSSDARWKNSSILVIFTR